MSIHQAACAGAHVDFGGIINPVTKHSTSQNHVADDPDVPDRERFRGDDELLTVFMTSTMTTSARCPKSESTLHYHQFAGRYDLEAWRGAIRCRSTVEAGFAAVLWNPLLPTANGTGHVQCRP
nr:hypothetical protein CFP56_19505 [Quercus suber]